MTREEKLKIIYENAYQAESRCEEVKNPWSCLTLESKAFDIGVINAVKNLKDFCVLSWLSENKKK